MRIGPYIRTDRDPRCGHEVDRGSRASGSRWQTGRMADREPWHWRITEGNEEDGYTIRLACALPFTTRVPSAGPGNERLVTCPDCRSYLDS